MIGFANKGNAMKTIKNNFTEGEDYKKLLFHMEKQVQNGRNLGGAGLNQETVMLNVDTFKNLCMLAKTERGKQIRKYYVKLENVYNEIVMEEIKESKKELEESKKELATLKKLKTKKWYNQEPGYRNVLGIWGLQLKSENAVRIGINPTHRKEIVKVDYETKKIIQEYKSLTIASNILKLERENIRNCIRDKRLINDSFLLQYKKDVDLL